VRFLFPYLHMHLLQLARCLWLFLRERERVTAAAPYVTEVARRATCGALTDSPPPLCVKGNSFRNSSGCGERRYACMSRPRCTWEAKNEGGEKKLFVIGSWKMLEFKIRLTIWAHSMTAFLCKKKNEPSVIITGEQMNELINPVDPFAGRLKQQHYVDGSIFPPHYVKGRSLVWRGILYTWMRKVYKECAERRLVH
jgi:hypothetical protein